MIGFYFLISRIFGFMNQILYVGSNDSLPEPLSKSEEEFCLVMAEDGDLSCRDRLIEHNLRLVVFLAKKYENTGVDLEDLVSIGTIGLIKGIKTYRMDKNIKLATYASRCIDNEILMYYERIRKFVRKFRLTNLWHTMRMVMNFGWKMCWVLLKIW